MGPRLESLGIAVSHAISDRAKVLIKLAVGDFGQLWVAVGQRSLAGLSR